ncbi:MAC/perforin domain-containing protein [Dysgonomonas capnocytophagoides]|uniref:MAC/perforin domain-containing protein n=1 Tax=Dysgonomonas capnocytophagoides TaxID=45254 RepID=UPI0029231103|nr:hypothetical protein DCPSUM001_25710 [Dysgonomonas capnocytophagoides]
MKRAFKFGLLSLSILVLSSCENETLNQDSINNTSLEDKITSSKMILIKKRTAPFIISSGMDSIYRENDADINNISIRTNSNSYNLKNLGSGFKLNYRFPIEDPINITFPVVDPYKIYNDDDSNIVPLDLLTTDNKFFAFAKEDNYYAKSEMSKTVKHGTSAGVKDLISFGVKTTYKEVFKTSSSDENKSVYGELSIYIDRYKLALNPGNIYDYSEKYVTNGFRNTLYENSIIRTLSIYGTHVLANYSLGGSANALYIGSSKTTTNTESKEKDLEIALRNSFKLFSNNISFNLSTKAKDSVTTRFSKVDISIKTIGGDTGLGITTYTSPEDISKVNIDLSSWAKSVDNNNAIINHINEEGLIPLYDFVLEDNFKKLIKQNLSDYRLSSNLANNSNFSLIEPRIGYMLIYIGANRYLATFLSTRHYTSILLGLKEIPKSVTNEIGYIYSLATGNELSDGTTPAATYGETIFEGLSAYINEEPWMSTSDINSLYSDFYDFTNINKSSIKLCQIEGQTIKYILFNSNGKKYALGIHADYILDTYGLKQIKNMNVEKISTLKGYTVIGL